MTLRCEALSLEKGSWQGRFDFALAPGQWLSVLGESGAGKSSLLTGLMGFVAVKSGRLAFDGQDLTHRPPSQRPMAMAFQDNALLGHISLEKSMMLSLHDAPLSRQEKRAIIAEELARLMLPLSYLQRLPKEVSGGELARFNLCSALLRQKPILLLDEPFAALDKGLRKKLVNQLKTLQIARGLTIICATHDLSDVVAVSDGFLMVEQGKARPHHPAQKAPIGSNVSR